MEPSVLKLFNIPNTAQLSVPRADTDIVYSTVYGIANLSPDETGSALVLIAVALRRSGARGLGLGGFAALIRCSRRLYLQARTVNGWI